MASLSHSFDISLATQYGIEEAILLHHFQHWIRVNKKLNRNFINGRFWSYQTYNEIAAHFPYLSYNKVRFAIKKLINNKILIKDNFNTRNGDNTPWFAFQDESKFLKPIPGEKALPHEDLVNFTGVCENSQGSVKIHRALPDTITNTKPDKSKGIARERGASPKSAPPPAPRSHYVGRFEDKILISALERERLVTKYGGMESLVDTYAEKLYKYALKKPKKFEEYGRHDLVIESWIDDDLAKDDSKPKNEKKLPFTENLKPIQLENFKKNHYIVEQLIAENPAVCSGLEFYYKAHVLRDKKSPNFSVSGLLDHRSFCRVLDKHLGSSIEEEVFGYVEFI